MFRFNKTEWISIGIVALLHSFFFVYAFNHHNIYLADDSQEYLWQAYNLKYHGSWYGSDYNLPYNAYLQTRRPPLYGIFIFLAKGIYNSDYFVCLLQNILSIISIIAGGLIAKKLKAKTNWLIMPVMLLFFPTQLIYANRIMADVLFQSLIVFSVWFFIKYNETARIKFLFLVSICIALSALTKPVLYLFAPVLIAFFVWLFLKNRISAKKISISFIPLIAGLLLSFYNLNQTGYFHFSSGNNMMVYHYYSTSARFNGGENDFAKSDSVTALAKSNSSSLKKFSQNMTHSFFHIMREKPMRFTMLQLNGMLQFFIDHGRWDIESFFVTPIYMQRKGWKNAWQKKGLSGIMHYIKSIGYIKFVYLTLTLLINIILSILFFRFLTNKSIDKSLRIILMLITIYMVTITGFVGGSRYRMALYPFLICSVFVFISDYQKKKLSEKNSKSV